jgi:valyl-tRNA synthetase
VAPNPPQEGYPALDDAETLETFHDLQSATRAVREVRTTSGIAPKDKVNVTIKSTPQRIEHLEHEAHILKRMARIENLVLDNAASRPPNSAVKIVGKLQIFVHDVVDDAQERERVEKDVVGLDKRIKSSEGRLSNEGYLRSAPPEVVEETRRILEGLKTERQTLEEVLQLLAQ